MNTQESTTMGRHLLTVSRLVSRLKNVGGVLALLAVGLILSGQTVAGCGNGAAPNPKHSSNGFAPMVYRPAEAIRAGFVSAFDDGNENASIVGLWEFEFHLNGAQNGLPDKALFDWGLATWHDDGTEIQFSAGRPPSDGDVCMGAWEQVGRSRFKLHHVALGLDPMTGLYDGPAIIRATVTVDPSGNSYSGSYSVTIYPGSPSSGTPFDEFNDAGAPLVAFTGTIVAHRVTAD